MSDFTAERCRELVELGPQAYQRALGEAVCVSVVEETATNTLDNSSSLNSIRTLTIQTTRYPAAQARRRH